MEISGRKRGGITFREAFEKYFEKKREQISNAKHLKQWQSTMDAYVFPVIGNRLVDDIRRRHRPGVDTNLERDPKTAHRVLQRMHAVFEDAIRLKHRTRACPTIGVVKTLAVWATARSSIIGRCPMQFARVVDRIIAAKRTFVFGIGPSSAMADYLVIQLGRFGLPAISSTRTGLLLADDLRQLQGGDSVVVFAYSRQYPEVAALHECILLAFVRFRKMLKSELRRNKLRVGQAQQK